MVVLPFVPVIKTICSGLAMSPKNAGSMPSAIKPGSVPPSWLVNLSAASVALAARKATGNSLLFFCATVTPIVSKVSLVYHLARRA